MIGVQPAAARKFDLSLFLFPLRGQTGARVPTHAAKRVARQQTALARPVQSGSHKRAAPPCASPAALTVLTGFARLRPGQSFR